MKKIILGVSAGISLIVFLILAYIANHLGQGQLSQTVADRWDAEGGSAQVSCFFSVSATIGVDQIVELEHTVESKLAEVGVFADPEKPTARMWIDAFSASGNIQISTDRASVDAEAIGVGGDFFLFHPVKLLYGSYFSGEDLMQDYCIIDRDAAWQLFGSDNVAGMQVTIGGVPHIVSGVIDREDGRLAEAAGLSSTLVYVSYGTLDTYGYNRGINCYEMVMPEPVDGFTLNFIKEGLPYAEKDIEITDVSGRYSFINRAKLIAKFGTRSMNSKAIIYPYWENIARGYDDILALITLLEILFLLYSVVCSLCLFASYWKHKGWTVHEKMLWLADKAERLWEKVRLRLPRKKDIQD